MSRKTLSKLTTVALGIVGFLNTAHGQTFAVSWDGGASGLYSSGLSWSTNVVPLNNAGLGDFFNVTINRSGGTTVTGDFGSGSILNLTIGANAGNHLQLVDTAALSIIGASGGGAATVNNQGTISLGSTLASTAQLLLSGTSTNLTGGGTINLLGSSLVGGAGTITSNNTLVGTGSVGNNTLTFVNNGTITASGGNLTLDPRTLGGLDNNGLMQALAGGTLILSGNGGGAFDNAGGTISVAAAGGRVNLVDGAAIVGGTIQTSGLNTSIFFVPGGEAATLNGVTNAADVNVGLTSTLNLLGTITNNRRIRTNSSSGVATYNIGSSTVTLNGTGSLALSQLASSFGNLVGTGTLVNGASHTIAGAGTLGDGSTTILNNGTIDANLAGQVLNIRAEALGSGGVANTGTIRASTGELRIHNSVQITNSGTFQVASSGTMTLDTSTIGGDMLITGGTIAVSSGGLLRSLSSVNQVGLANLTLVNAGTVNMDDTTWFITNPTTFSNSANVNVEGDATLSINSGDTATFNGNGQVNLLASTSTIEGLGTLNNISNSIRGQGNIGGGSLTIVNAGTISADVSGGTLTIQPGPGGLTNTGTLTSVNNSDLNLSGGTINNTGGMIFANNSGINLRNNVFITGGTLNNVSGGPNIFVPGGNTATIANLTNDGVISVSSASAGTLNLAGTITNNGRINIAGTAVMTVSGGTATLAGAGSISLTGTIMGVGTLDNSSNQIRGLGAISVAKLINGSNGTISADQSGQTLRLIASNFLVNYENQGIMRATNGGILQLESGFFGGGHINTGDGTMLAENASTLRLEATGLSGGTLSTSGTGSIDINSSSLSNLTLNGNVIHDSGTLTIGTLVTNNGSITTLNGLNVEISNQVPSTLVNNGTMSLSSGTIAFSQILGGGTLVNTGRIAGNFRIDPSGTATFAITNSGLMETTAAGETVSWDNQGGTPLAITANHTGTLRANSGGSILINTGVIVTGNGTVDVRSGANFATGGTVTIGGVTNDGTALIINTANLGRVSGAGTMNVGFTLLGTQLGNVTVTHLRQTTVNLFNGSTITTATGGGTLGTSRVTNFNTINTGTGAFAGRWNLSNHDLVVDYAVSSPFGSVLALVQQGFAGGAWTGNGLTSSAAQAAASTSDKTGLAIVEAGELFPSFPRDFSGQSIDSTTVLVKYTLLGDTNLDSIVNITDFAALAANFNTGGRWNRGDFNYDSQINIADFALLASNFNKSLPIDVPRGGSVPEPTVAVLGLAVIATLRRRRNI